MSEQAPEQPTPPETGSEEQPKQPKPTETVEFWKQKAREQEGRAKSNADAAKRLEEIENAGKSESERLTSQAQEAQTRAEQAESRALRLEVAFEKGLTPAQAKRLVGSSREELEADAEEIKRDFPTAPATPPAPRGGEIKQGIQPPAKADVGFGTARLAAAYESKK